MDLLDTKEWTLNISETRAKGRERELVSSLLPFLSPITVDHDLSERIRGILSSRAERSPAGGSELLHIPQRRYPEENECWMVNPLSSWAVLKAVRGGRHDRLLCNDATAE